MRDKAKAVVDTAIKAATAYHREDLAKRLEATAATLDDGTVRVMVVGEFKQGKSSLVNALLNAPVCPVDDDVATSVPTIVRHSDEPRAALIRSEPDRPDRADGTSTEPIDVGSLPVYASEMGNPGNELGLLAVEVGLPRSLLAQGLTFVDTPGVGGLGSAHTAATMAALPTADVVLFVSDASQELTSTEFDFLKAAIDNGVSCGFVLTKTDFYPDWRRIVELNRGHLERLGTTIPILTTSALLRTKAIESDDKQLNLESGYPDLIQFVTSAAGDAAGRATGAVVDDLRSVVEQLRSSFDSERQMLEDPDRAEAMMAEFARAKERADALRDQAARWQVTLNDGVADLSADFDHRLRARLRATSTEADAALEDQEPGLIWDEFSGWLRRRVSHDLAQTYLELTRRTHELSELVAAHFDDGRLALSIDLDPNRALTTASAIDPRTRIDPIKTGTGTKAMTAMRGSYGGLLMFGMMAQLAGMAMMNPATAAIGLLMGRKAVKDDRERQLTAQRQQAKVTSRQFIDDTAFEVAKEMKDSLRILNRRLRDHYQDRAEEMQRSIATALGSAKEGLATNQQDRQRRLRDVTAELQRLDGLSAQVEELAVSGRG
ncbi:MAG: dynamin family protein [Actinomycetota bacterium]